MEDPVDRQQLPLGKPSEAPTEEELDSFISLLPGLFYGVNRIMEDSAPLLSSGENGPRVSRKVVVALWALRAATLSDSTGRYLTTSDLVATFRDWFVVSEDNASSFVSKVKTKMFDDHQYISIQGGRDHIHLTEKGEAALAQMVDSAKRIIESAISPLHQEERQELLRFAQRMVDNARITASKKPVTGQLF
jgi:hypothetical protein